MMGRFIKLDIDSLEQHTAGQNIDSLEQHRAGQTPNIRCVSRLKLYTS